MRNHVRYRVKSKCYKIIWNNYLKAKYAKSSNGICMLKRNLVQHILYIFEPFTLLSKISWWKSISKSVLNYTIYNYRLKQQKTSEIPVCICWIHTEYFFSFSHGKENENQAWKYSRTDCPFHRSESGGTSSSNTQHFSVIQCNSSLIWDLLITKPRDL